MNYRVLLIMLFTPIWMYAQELEVKGFVKDLVTHVPLQGSKVELLTADSVVIDSTKSTGGRFENGKLVEVYSRFIFTIKKPGKYLIRANMKGYDTNYAELNLSKLYSREQERTIDPIYLQRTITKKIDEVTVTATKVKFYNRGDTLVYNADAFQLAEGSMLDALIRQLPGAELKSDGRIYVKGKFIENLLLNGQDFFKGNNQIMLDNLPAYTVNQVKVYDKAGDLTRLAGLDVGDKKYVMDIKLKKQYNTGWLANLEVGAGTEHRFMSRLFAMRYTDHSRLTFYGSLNNINDARKPGQNTEWTPEQMPKGLMTTQLTGVDYNIDDRNKRFNLAGNAQFKQTREQVERFSNRTNFLSGGNSYERIVSSNRNHDTRISTTHRFSFYTKKWDLKFNPFFNYRHYRNMGDLSAATSPMAWTEFTQVEIDSILSMPMLSSTLQRKLINRQQKQHRTSGYEWDGGINASASVKIPHTSDILSFDASLQFFNAKEDAFSRSQIDYFSTQPAMTDYRNQYEANIPKKGYDYKFKASYLYAFKQGLSLTLSYQFNNTHQTASSGLYRLDQINGWGMDTDYALGKLPSVNLYAPTRDGQNSYNSRQNDYTHEGGLFFYWNKWVNNKYEWWAQLDVPMDFLIQNLSYKQGTVDTTIVRHSWLPYVRSSFIQWGTLNKKHRVMLNYNLDSQAPSMTYFVNVENTKDPLNIFRGNAQLKNTYMHKWTLDYAYSNSRLQSYYRPYISYSLMQNALAMGYIYDKETGLRTITPENVNGNWDGTLGFTSIFPFDKKRKVIFTNDLSATHINSVDFAGVAGSLESGKSIVKTMKLYESVKLEYKFGKNSLTAKGDVSWLHSNSSRSDFSTIKVVNFDYGLIALLRLPWDIQLSTDLTMYSRRGYEDVAMNANNLVWNARLSRQIFKNKLTLMLDGFDILDQLDNITRTLNAQGQTELRTNVIPQYVMLHAAYHFNIIPK